ncbi:response regulator transcription factor [Lysobacter sp. A6]|uniref:Response regulator transcription factor n=1 Tax=Noviluteimonas lactosilytica TaxID=2888523 RepID=A0ABS8JMK3_9GAMM|nr:response regulator transcription factor [Lysobacter lactosilyticus]
MQDPAATPSPHVLVIEDDRDVAALVDRYLTTQGLLVTLAGNGSEALMAVAQSRVDVALLDLGLPGEDGLSILRKLQTQWGGPVIIVSGRGDAVDRIVGLELGADDYVTKPFDFRELLARVRSVLRRADRTTSKVLVGAGNALRIDKMRLERDTRRLVRADGVDIPLSSGEFDLLSALAEKPGHVFSRDVLMQALHGHDAGPYDRSIDVQIGRLRRKIEADPENPRIIKSVRGVGYVLTAPVAPAS